MACILIECLPLTSGGAPLRVVAMRLVAAIGVGAASQISVQMALWVLCGMPRGPEHRSVQIVASLWRRAVLVHMATRRRLQLR
jgi:hypothetical protein